MKTKHLTVKQIPGDEVTYRVTKTVDTITPMIGENLTPVEVDRYCHNRQYKVTVLPGSARTRP